MLLNYKDTGAGPLIVLLHGMAGSHRYWNNFLPFIGKGNRIISIDLLGFGQSPMPANNEYNYESHILSIKDTLAHAGVNNSFTLVGHSMGALIALKYASVFPDEIKKLGLVAMPIHDSPESARNAITGGSKLKALAYYGLTSRILCNLWCRILRPLSRRAAPKYLPHLTEESASDSVLHTWRSYSKSLRNIIENQDVPRDLALIKCPAMLLYGDKDTPRQLEDLGKLLARPNLILKIEEGTHQIAHEKPASLSEWLVG